MSVVKKKMKLGQNPANDLVSDFFSINQCGEEIQETNQLQVLSLKEKEEVQLTTQGVTDVFKFLDPAVLTSIVGFIKEIDINEIKRIINFGSKLFEIDDEGNIFVNLKIKLNNVKSNPLRS